MNPSGWISERCHVSSSQEEMMNTAPYLLPNLPPSSESESEDGEETVVCMMSVPETSGEDEFRTPPERHSNSITSEAVIHEDEEVVCAGNQEDKDMEEEEEKTVDLNRDSEVFGCESRLNRSSGALVDGSVREVENCIGEDNANDYEDLVMEDGRFPFSHCYEASIDVEGNHGSSANAEKLRTFDDAETDELLRSGKDVVKEVEHVTFTATLNVSSLNVRKLPSSFCTVSKGHGAIRTDKRDAGVETSQAVGHSSVAANKQGTGDADDGSGKKCLEACEKEEPNDDEQMENILQVLGLLAKPLRPVYTEKVDIIGSAIKAGMTFPLPSWWTEDSDDDSLS